MNGTPSRILTTRPALAAAALACAGFMFATVPASAQGSEEIVVTAPREVHVQRVGTSATGAPIERISLSHQVSYADLDLSQTKDADILKQRVADTAKQACKQLDSLYPLMPSDPNCVRTATKGAMEQVNKAIAGAGM